MKCPRCQSPDVAPVMRVRSSGKRFVCRQCGHDWKPKKKAKPGGLAKKIMKVQINHTVPDYSNYKWIKQIADNTKKDLNLKTKILQHFMVQHIPEAKHKELARLIQELAQAAISHDHMVRVLIYSKEFRENKSS